MVAWLREVAVKVEMSGEILDSFKSTVLLISR